MRLAVSVFYFSLLLISTTALYAQSRQPAVLPALSNIDDQVVNAIQNQRLGEIEKRNDEITSRVNTISESVQNLAGSMNRFTGIGIGLGSALVALQGLQIVLQVKRSFNKREG